MNDLSFVCLLNFSELTGSLSTIYALLFGALAFLGYQLVAEMISEGQAPAEAPSGKATGYWEDYTLPVNQLSKGVVIPLLKEEQRVEEAKSLQDPTSRVVIPLLLSEEDRGILEAFGLVDQDSQWLLDEDPYWGPWTEADRLAIEALANPPVVRPLGELLDGNPFEGEASALNQLTLEELIGGVSPAEDEDPEAWDSPGFWARHI